MAAEKKSLGEKAWARLETPQGYAFISDDIIYTDDANALDRLEGSLQESRKVVRILSTLISEYKHGG